jgi:hypothetical protein
MQWIKENDMNELTAYIEPTETKPLTLESIAEGNDFEAIRDAGHAFRFVRGGDGGMPGAFCLTVYEWFSEEAFRRHGFTIIKDHGKLVIKPKDAPAQPPAAPVTSAATGVENIKDCINGYRGTNTLFTGAHAELAALLDRIKSLEEQVTAKGHVAWQSGHDTAVAVLCYSLNKIMDGETHSLGVAAEPWHSTRLRLHKLVTAADADKRTIETYNAYFRALIGTNDPEFESCRRAALFEYRRHANAEGAGK